MSLPFFYIEEYDLTETGIILDEDNSKHVVNVLRMKPGGLLHLTDGKGNLLVAEIANGHKKHCKVEVKAVSYHPQSTEQTSIGISLLKNSNRFEWFLEKVTEIGIQEIIPLICERTERQKFRTDRMKSILISAMLQSEQTWLPTLHEPQKINDVILQYSNFDMLKCIAYCSEEEKQSIANFQIAPSNSIVLIGPEGDFTKEETDLATYHKFIPVTLGNTRLRSETAGVVAAVLLKNSYYNTTV